MRLLQERDFSNEQEAREYADEWNKEGFTGTDNWGFAKGGLVFLFQSYEVGAYIVGVPEIFLSNQQLKDVIKPEILREAEKYQGNPKY
ncbi:RsiV family protein [Haemophilus haemolyticus]|uniref:RsiV family protein n=1 Tax=Haemophilus haemolyticus TaxID=726 RepID=UPI000E581822|nr:RsiV family protein [Haemophilus haemolyticus]